MKAPRHLGPDGRKLWRQLTAGYDFSDQGGQVLLTAACELLDRLRQTEAEIEREGAILEDNRGRKYANPRTTIARDLRSQYLAVFRQLKLPPPVAEPPTPDKKYKTKADVFAERRQ
jgi:P27 family predicted phage terminase small subunit